MELVYLWVEDYKNIKKQGFNFSPRFRCKFYDEYDENGKLKDNCKLDIKPNEHIENFFGDNINITAIVGKNGSGKSSVLKIILFLFSHYQDNELKLENSKSLFLFFIDDSNNKKYIGYNIDIQSNNFTKYINGKLDFYTIYLNYMIDTLNDGNDDFIDSLYHKSNQYTTPILIEPYKHKNQLDLSNLSYLTKYKFRKTFYKNRNNRFIDNFFKPNYIKYTVNKAKTDRNIRRTFSFSIRTSIEMSNNQKKVIEIENLNYIIKNYHDIDNIIKYLEDIKHRFKDISEIQRYIKYLESNNKPFLENKESNSFISLNSKYIANKVKYSKIYSKDFFDKDLLYINTDINYIEKVNKYLIRHKSTDFFLNSILLDRANSSEYLYLKVKNASLFYYEILKDNKLKKIFEDNIDKKILIRDIENIFKYLPPWVDIEYYQDDKSYSSFSGGEKAFFSFMMGLIYHIENINEIYKKEKRYKSINIFLDETELGFHPQWQKEYLSQLLLALDNFDIKINLVITTHSPFLLSDIPKQNIIFLDTDDNGKCIVVDGLKDKKETFGANIHTLLSDSFFMEDGLMGEFAKGKIDNVIKILNRDKITKIELKECEQIISIIGEPIIKKQLQRMLDSKRLKKVDEIDIIKKDMRRLEHRLRELENRDD